MSVSPPTRTIPDNLADLVGNTPMVRLTRVAPECDAELIAKLEAYNPGGSVKDRIGVNMIDAMEAAGHIRPGTTLIEPTSGTVRLRGEASQPNSSPTRRAPCPKPVGVTKSN